MRINGLLSGLVLIAVLLAGCGDDDDTDPGEIDATLSASATPVQSATPTVDAAIAALFGQWQTTISAGDSVTLALREGTYAIGRGAATGRGRMKVTAGGAEFSGSDLCDGIGNYRWSLQGDTLSFTSVGEDECSGRSEVLDGITYKKRQE